jgi:hypothetical protein
MKFPDLRHGKSPHIMFSKCLLWVVCSVATFLLLGGDSCQEWRADKMGWFGPTQYQIENHLSERYEVENSVDPAANPAITYPSQPYIPMLQRQANCSLTRFVLDQNYNVLAMDTNYQDYLHNNLLPSTQGDLFKGGCSDTNIGIGSQPGSFVPLAGGGGAVVTISPNGVNARVVTAAGTIQSTTDYPTGTQANGSVGTALGDFNGDGKLDLVVVNYETAASTSTGSVAILLGNGDGTFQTPVDIALPIQAFGLTIDDLNGDGHLDLAVIGTSSDGSASSLQVLLGKGDGSFSAPVSGPSAFTGSSTSSCTNAAGADFNGDGKTDLATNCGQILLGNGDGTFTMGAGNVYSGQGVTAADLNGDGKIDLAVADPFTLTVQTYLGNGDGTFSFSGAYASPYGIAAIRALDLDGDGYTDLFVGSASNGVFGTGSQDALSQFQSLLGYGNGSFVGVPAYMAQASLSNRLPMYYGLGDLNGDGKPDMVYIDQNQSGLILQTLIGEGGTAFKSGPQTPVSNVSQFSLSAVVLADFNGDGKLDVAFADNGNLNSGNPPLQVAFGNGDGTFAPAKPYTGFSTGVSKMLVADFNADGKLDIAYIGLNPQSKDANGNETGGVYILLNKGDGTFASPQLAGLSTTQNLGSLATADLNGDAKADLVVASSGTLSGNTTAPGSIYSLLGKGDGTFGAPAALSATASWGPVAVADMNKDGRPDILAEGAGQSGATNLSVFPGNGDGTFGTPAVTALEDGGSDTIAVGDIDLDGNLDVVSGGCCGLSYTDVLIGNGDGTFANPANQELLLGLSSHHLTLASLDGTKNLDLILVATNENTVDTSIEVIPNLLAGAASSQAPTTTTLSASAATLAPGASVTFTAKVAESSGSGVPTGSVVFLDGATMIGTGTLDATGTASFSTSLLAAGAHSITASYGGDAGNAASLSAIVTITVSGAQLVATTTALSTSSASIAAGSSVTLTAAVSGTGGTPTGTVTFSDGSTKLGTGTLNSSGRATYSTSSLAIGAHSITATYGGDTNFAASTSAAVTVTVTAAVPPGFGMSLSPASGSVAPGSTTTATITITPTGGFNSQVSLACTGLPVYSTCSFSPATVTPSGSAAATTTLTLATNVATASMRKPDQPNVRRAGYGEAFLALVLLGMSGLVRQRRKWSGLRWHTPLSVLLVAALATALVACGGGGSSSGSGGSTATSTTTPAGISTVTVTATAGSLSKTATFTFTVQ